MSISLLLHLWIEALSLFHSAEEELGSARVTLRQSLKYYRAPPAKPMLLGILLPFVEIFVYISSNSQILKGFYAASPPALNVSESAKALALVSHPPSSGFTHPLGVFGIIWGPSLKGKGKGVNQTGVRTHPTHKCTCTHMAQPDLHTHAHWMGQGGRTWRPGNKP